MRAVALRGAERAAARRGAPRRRSATRATRVRARALERDLERTTRAAAADARAALAPRRDRPRSGDEAALAAARGRIVAALRRGAYAVDAGAQRERPTSRPRARWLLVRDFRQATRFTRPGVDATAALDALEAGDIDARRGGAAGQEGPARRLSGPARRLPRRGRAASRSAASAPALAESAALAAATGRSSPRSTQRAARRSAERAKPIALSPVSSSAAGDADPGRFARRDAGARAARRVHRGAVHARGAGAARGAADPLPRPGPDRVRPRHRGRPGDDPVRAPGDARLHRRRAVGVRRPRGRRSTSATRRRSPSVERDLERLRTTRRRRQRGGAVVALEQVEALRGASLGHARCGLP